jgi:hypothetical protein
MERNSLLNLFQYKKEFDMRHEFDESEMDVLRERFPWITISNIPISWIIAIDIMLCRFRYSSLIKGVDQQYGQLILSFLKDPEQQHLDVIAKVEAKLKAIDVDLEL